MSTRAHRYGRPQMNEDPIKDAVEAHLACVSMQVAALRSHADCMADSGRRASAEQIRQTCIVLKEAGDKLGERVLAALKDKEAS